MQPEGKLAPAPCLVDLKKGSFCNKRENFASFNKGLVLLLKVYAKLESIDKLADEREKAAPN